MKSIPAERVSHLEIRVGNFEAAQMSLNSLCYYHDGLVSAGSTLSIVCSKASRGKYLYIHKIHAYDNLNVQPLNFCEVRAYLTKGETLISIITIHT